MNLIKEKSTYLLPLQSLERGESPFIKRIMYKNLVFVTSVLDITNPYVKDIGQASHLNDGEECLLVCPHYRECFFAASSEHSVYTCHSHAVNYVSRQPKRYLP